MQEEQARETTETPLRLAILPIEISSLASGLHLPKAYHIVSASYHEQSRMLDLLITGDDLPAVKEGSRLPMAKLFVHVEWISDELHEYQKFTTELRVTPF